MLNQNLKFIIDNIYTTQKFKKSFDLDINKIPTYFKLNLKEEVHS